MLLRVLNRLPTTCRTSLGQQQRHIHTTIPSYNAIDKVAENKIAEWLHSKGDESIGSSKKNKKLTYDRHKDASRTLGVYHDYVHSKILADNNIKPESVERRQALDSAWEKLKREIRLSYLSQGNVAQVTPDEFVQSTKDQYEDEMKRLDNMAKKVNDSIISDSMRFNGRSPVKYARRFSFEERVREAIESSSSR